MTFATPYIYRNWYFFPTLLNPIHMDKSTLLDVILTNTPHKYWAVGIFCKDVSVNCTVACVGNCKLPKTKPQYIFKRKLKCLNEHAFLYEFYYSDMNFFCERLDVELAWNHFKTTFLSLIDNHAALSRLRVSGKDNPWFNDTIATSIRKRDNAWTKSKRTNDAKHWVDYRHWETCTSLRKMEKKVSIILI